MLISADDLLLLNQYAQGIRVINEGKDWFCLLSLDVQLEVLRALSNLILQAGASNNDVNPAIQKAGLKKTYTLCVLLQKEPIKVQLSKVLALPSSEYIKIFSLFISLFSIVDERRRETKCKNGCSHWWHKDLSNKAVVKQILKQLESEAGHS